MPDVLIYPKENGGKPVKVRWDSPDMPTDQDIEDMYSAYSKSNPQSIEPKPTGRIGSNPSRLGGTLTPNAVNPAGGFAPVVPGKTPGVANPMPNAPVNLPALALSGGNPGAIAGAITGKGSPPQPKMTQATKKAMTPSLPNSFQPSFVQRAQQAADISTQPVNQAAQKVQKEVTKQKREAQLKTNQGFETEKGIPAPKPIPPFDFAQRKAELGVIDPTTGEMRLSPENEKKIENEWRANWQARFGYDPTKNPARYAQDSVAELTGNIAKAIRPIVGPLDAAFTALPRLAAHALGHPEAEQYMHPLEQGISSLAALPADVMAEVPVILSPNASVNDRLGGILNIALKTGIAPLELFDQALKVDPKLSKFEEAVKNLSLEPNQRSAVVQQIKEAGGELKGFTPEGKPIARIKAQAKEINPNARQVQSPTEVHGNVPIEPIQGKQAVPPQEGSPGVQQEAPGRIPEAKPQAQAEVAPKKQVRHEDTAKIREQLGLPEHTKGGTDWDTAIKKAYDEGHVLKADQLVDDINQGRKNVYRPEERAAVAIKGSQLNDYLEKVGQEMESAKKSGDLETFNLKRNEYNDTKQRVNDYLDALDKSGSGAGDALQSSKIKFGDNLDPVRLERDFEAAAGRKPTETEYQELLRLREEVKKAKTAYLDPEEATLQKIAQKEVDRQAKTASRQARSKNIDEQLANLSKEFAKIGSKVSAGLDPEAYKLLAKAASLYIQKGVVKLEEVVANVKQHFEGITDRHVYDAIAGNYPKERIPPTEGQLTVRNLKTEAKIASIKNQIETGEINPKLTRPVLTPEQIKLKAELGKARKNLQRFIDSKRKLTPLDILAKYQRLNILSGPSVFAKLGVATAGHATITPIEELLGSAIGKAGVKHIEAFGSRKAEAAAIKEFFSKETWSDALAKAQGKGNSLDNAFGSEKFGHPVWEFFGNLHGAVKTPLQRAAFKREAIKMTEFLAKRGVDVASPEALGSIATHAYQKSLEAILMNDGKAVQAARGIIGKIPLGKTIAPIVRVPINFAGRTGEYVAGIPYAMYKQLAAKVSNTVLDDAAKGAILRAYKRGGVGAGLVVLGFYNPDLTENLPNSVKHTPILEAIDMGSAIRKGYDAPRAPKTGEHAGEQPDTLERIGSSLFQTSGEMLGNIPGAQQLPALGQLAKGAFGGEPGVTGKAAADYIMGIVMPQLAQQVSKYFDAPEIKKGEKYYRARGFREELQKSTPGLRQQLPQKETPAHKEKTKAEQEAKTKAYANG